MFECQVCGLLSLRGNSCPACGSQLRNDLSAELESDGHLPTDVPGLDDAAEAWYELEGIEAPKPSEEPTAESSSSALPFGFQGESNVVESRLPFGIGSYAQGVPFDATIGEEPISPSPPAVTPVETIASIPATLPEPVASAPIPVVAAQSPPEVVEAPEVTSVKTVVSLPATPPEPVASAPTPVVAAQSPPEVFEAPKATPVRLDAAIVAEVPDPIATISAVSPPRLEAAPVVVASQPVLAEPDSDGTESVPDYWKIDAEIPDYEEIYGMDEEVVQVDYGSFEEDVLVYDHSTDSSVAVFHSPLEASPAASPPATLSLGLHPAQALAIELGGQSELMSVMNDGFRALQSSSWVDAARSFQTLAAKMPNNPQVFNNYGISLLQRALDLNESPDSQQQSMASTQFESAILVLREAAKNAPEEGTILTNLAHALVESGRSEKALGIMNVHNSRTPGSAVGINTAAVAMFHLGQLSQAVEMLKSGGADAVIQSNLAQFGQSS